ncbi:chemotaxis protein CheA [Fusibacter ferrireducens]|uniref:Chemotaxis protein CheA n=1 Tax=Fusibacter ferrireducens TaxID=2785058 RepID=A0ABR9ZTK2_9FIRM|nr:chemotaxis protein CheA [Fusibacter ferrireducens]MBF4693794.1 chemotaxis protein CheA [Fusibacter ferrireducens]
MSDYNQNEPMIEMYVYETTQLIDRLEQLMMASEKEESLDFAIDEIFRIMHTIKGNSMMMMYEGIAVIAHRLEDLFDFLRNNKAIKYNPSRITDLTLAMIDFVKEEVKKLGQDLQPDGEANELRDEIVTYLESLKFMNDREQYSASDESNIKPQYYISPKKVENSEGNLKSDESNPFNYFRLKMAYEDGCGMENIRAFTFVHSIKDKVNGLIHIPVDITGDPGAADHIVENGFRIYLKSEMSIEEMQEVVSGVSFLKTYDLLEIDEQIFSKAYKNIEAGIFEESILENETETNDTPDDELDKNTSGETAIESDSETVETDEGDVKNQATDPLNQEISHLNQEINREKKVIKTTKSNEVKTDVESKKVAKQSFISVDVTRVDKLMDLVGELVVSESMVTRNPEIQNLHLENFEKAARQFRIIMNELQDTVMSMRMVPLTLTFQKMTRIVRDMKKKVGKEVDLIIIGETTEVDKNVIENITDPLMHIIRNSMDHGLESTEERIDMGKPEKGTIVLEAKHSGGDVWIIVKDDGKGLDREKILDKCEERNLLTRQRSEYQDREVYEMLFEPGFSTKDQVTEFSGRGVGLDVVARNIKKLGGSVIVSSELGIGTEFAIKIPLTLAIINGMMMQVGKTIFSIPIISIRESFIAKESDITQDPDGNELVMVRGQVFPILRLHEKYGIETEITNFNEGILIMIEENGKEKVFFADAILGEQQLVVKSAPKYLKTIDGMTGFALLGDGRISLILDPDSLVN